MNVTSVMVQNGTIVGAVIEVNDTSKKARISDLIKLCTLNKIDSGCKLIDGKLYFDASVLAEEAEQTEVTVDHYDYNSDGKIEQAVLTDGRAVSLNDLWKLAADHRVTNAVAAYNRRTSSKILQIV